MLIDVLPAWVEADPLRSRAVDAIGLQQMADQLADRLLPGVSVLTRRARYYSFLAWAREKTGTTHEERAIHQWEVALALMEGGLSARDPAHGKTCEFIGSRRVRELDDLARAPSDPRAVYKVPTWRAYRASMTAIGLLSKGPRFGLQDDGFKLAKAFGARVRPRYGPRVPLPTSACLSAISGREIRILRTLFGISRRGRLAEDSSQPALRRAAFAREARAAFRAHGNLSPELLLIGYERTRGRLEEPANTLRLAAVWERLSLGLNALFIGRLHAVDRGDDPGFEKIVARALSTRSPTASLEPIRVDGPADVLVRSAVASLRHGLRLHDELRDRGLPVPDDQTAVDLARGLLGGVRKPRDRARKTLECLLARHELAKGDEAWIRRTARGRLEIARDPGDGWTIPAEARPHPYRMAAFGQLVTDLGGI